MTKRQRTKLREHPNLVKAIQNGTLVEANGDFIAVAEEHPLAKKDG